MSTILDGSAKEYECARSFPEVEAVASKFAVWKIYWDCSMKSSFPLAINFIPAFLLRTWNLNQDNAMELCVKSFYTCFTYSSSFRLYLMYCISCFNTLNDLFSCLCIHSLFHSHQKPITFWMIMLRGNIKSAANVPEELCVPVFPGVSFDDEL